jgi:hypothetical protein
MMTFGGGIAAAACAAVLLSVLLFLRSQTEQVEQFQKTAPKPPSSRLYVCPLTKSKATEAVRLLDALRGQWGVASDAIHALLTKPATEGFHNPCETDNAATETDKAAAETDKAAAETEEQAARTAENAARRRACGERIATARTAERALYSRYNGLVGLINKKIEGAEKMIEAKRIEAEQNKMSMDAMAKL